jgi:N-acetylglucosaminyldiphosphoundecaprenol N-acetyl-beta-D-mannosaminyltransferase
VHGGVAPANATITSTMVGRDHDDAGDTRPLTPLHVGSGLMTVATAIVAGVPIALYEMERAVAELLSRATGVEEAAVFRLVNAYSVSLTKTDTAYRNLLSEGGINLADGKPVAFFAARAAGESVAHVRGPSFFERCLDAGREVGVRHYFLGSTAENLALLTEECQKRFPGIQIVGADSPPFRPLTRQEWCDQSGRIRRSGATVLWVGLGTPKQDFVADRLCTELQIPTAGVGAAFDFFSGNKSEAPHIVRRLALEWLFRLSSEPRRLWRRYLIGNAVFLWMVLRHRGDVGESRRCS